MNPTTNSVQRTWADEIDHRARLADAINRILQGKTNNVGTVTFTINSATTTLNDPRIGADSMISLHATTANAATAIATTYFGSPGDGTITINHANNAQADRTFRYAVIG